MKHLAPRHSGHAPDHFDLGPEFDSWRSQLSILFLHLTHVHLVWVFSSNFPRYGHPISWIRIHTYSIRCDSWLRVFALAVRKRDRESFWFGNPWEPQPRTAAWLKFMMVVQLVVLTIKRFLEHSGIGKKPAHQKEKPSGTPYLYGVG